MAARCLEDLPSTSLRGGLRRELDVAVVGAGVLGLATTDALVRRGVDVVCFDPGRPGQGQSGGWSRSFRNRHDDPRVVGLAVESRTGWSRWEDRLGQRLIGDEGTAYAGMAADDAHGLVVHEVSHAFVEPSRQAEVFGALAPMDGLLLHDPASGAIRARRTIDALVGWVGSRIVPAEVHGVTAPGDGDGAELHTADGIFRARHVVIAAGTATPRLAAGAGIEVPLDRRLHARPHFRVREEFRSAGLPCWVDRSGAFGETVYGSPMGHTGQYVVGLIGADVDIPMNDGLPPTTEMEAHVRRVSAYVGWAFPGFDPEPVGVRVCVMTKLPAGSDAFGVWQTDGISAVTGHNLFKLAPALGEILADTAVKNEVPDEVADLTRRAVVAP